MPDGSTKSFPLRVLYTGAIRDLSGYASAARDYVRSLDAVGVDVSVESRTFENQPQRLIEEVVESRLWTMMSRPRNPHVQIIHLTPDNYSVYRDSKCKRVGYFAWETSKLPVGWVASINSVCHEVWVPCKYLADVSRLSGVTVPTYVLPHAIPIPPRDFSPKATIGSLPADRFKFYSIFQWSERKNPMGTLRAYYEEFDRSDPVVFVLKTYRVGAARTERDFIRREISKLKRATKGPNCPPVILIEDFLGFHDIQAVHHYCDCYVSMARSEGFGIPAFEAASFGNPVIVPRYSAFPEYLTDRTAYLVDVPREVPVGNMRHISVLYTGDMVWGDPSVEDCRRQMRAVYEDQTAARGRGAAARKWISENLSYHEIGTRMRNRLEGVYLGR